MAEIIYYDPVSRETWWPSRNEKPPYWADHTPEYREYHRRRRIVEDMMGHEPRDDYGLTYFQRAALRDCVSNVYRPADRCAWKVRSEDQEG